MRERASDCARTRGVRALRHGGLLVYARILPARAASIPRIRNELGRALARLGVGEKQRADVALLVTEAATNVVLHAYVGRPVGSLCVSATMSGTTLDVTVADFGRGRTPRTDSPGLGLGESMMAQLADELRHSANGDGKGHRLVARFRHAIPAQSDPAPSPPVRRARALCEQSRSLRLTSATLHQQSLDVVAEIRRTRTRSRRRQ
jgi:anti-sigma regulatory factor (Ser/Thr protein kinase)